MNTILSIWLFLSAFALPSADVLTRWHNADIAIAILAASLVAPGQQQAGRLPPFRPA